MTFLARLSLIVFWLAILLWVSMLVTVGVAASFAFAILPDLGITMADYGAYDEAQHGRLAAGMLMEPMFAATDYVQVIAAVLTIVAVIGLFISKHFSMRSTATIARIICIVFALGLLAFRVGVTAPHVNAHLRNYWDAAKTGDLETARNEQEAFAGHHETMQIWYMSVFALLLITASVTAATSNSSSHIHAQSRLEEPKLLRKS